MCEHLSSNIAPDFAFPMAMRCCTVLKQNDTILKPFWLFTVNSWPHLILQECAVILAIDHFTNWQGMVNHKSNLGQEHDMRDCTAQFFFSLVTFRHTSGTPFCHFS